MRPIMLLVLLLAGCSAGSGSAQRANPNNDHNTASAGTVGASLPGETGSNTLVINGQVAK